MIERETRQNRTPRVRTDGAGRGNWPKWLVGLIAAATLGLGTVSVGYAQPDGDKEADDTASETDTSDADGDDRARSMDDLGPSQKEELADHLKSAREAYSDGRFDEVVPRMKKAYEIFPDPAFLYRIALSFERGNEPKKAIEAYERYLEEKPDSEKRGQVEKTLTHLRNRVRSRQAAEQDRDEETTVDEPPPRPPTAPTAFAIGGGVSTLATLTFGIVFAGANRQYNSIIDASRSQSRGATDVASTARRRNLFLGLTYGSAGLAAASLGTATALWLTGPTAPGAGSSGQVSIQLVPGPRFLGIAGQF